MKKMLIFALLLVGAFRISAQNKKTDKPNIIWLMSEDMSTDLECYGMPTVKTTNLNKLADEGVRFDDCFVTNPICSPSRSAMMVGVNQNKINAGNHRSNRNVPLDIRYKPYTYQLRKLGYTCILGNHAVMGKGRKIDCNFKTKPLGEWDGKTKFGLFDKYDDFEKADQPFFAQIQLKVTHRGDWWNDVRKQSKHPVNPKDVVLPKYYADAPAIRLDWAKYLDQIEYMDNEVGMIRKELKDKGLADNTIIVFIADNGRCNIKGKGYLHDPGLRIPLIVYNPKGLPGKKVRKDVVSSVDITATILSWAGIKKIPSYMTGRPIFNKNFKRDYVYSARDLWDEIREKSRSVTNGEWTYIRNDKPGIPWDAHQAYLEFFRPAVQVMRQLNEEGKLNKAQSEFFAPKKPKEELYNLKKDPLQLHNLANNPEYAEKLNNLREKTVSYDKQNKPVNNIYEPVRPKTLDVLAWLKTARPDAYKRMKAGEEIGIHKYTAEYNKAMKEKANKNKK